MVQLCSTHLCLGAPSIYTSPCDLKHRCAESSDLVTTSNALWGHKRFSWAADPLFAARGQGRTETVSMHSLLVLAYTYIYIHIYLAFSCFYIPIHGLHFQEKWGLGCMKMGDDKAVIFRGVHSIQRHGTWDLLSQDAQMVVYGHGVQQPIEIAPPLLAAWGSLSSSKSGNV